MSEENLLKKIGKMFDNSNKLVTNNILTQVGKMFVSNNKSVIDHVGKMFVSNNKSVIDHVGKMFVSNNVKLVQSIDASMDYKLRELRQELVTQIQESQADTIESLSEIIHNGYNNHEERIKRVEDELDLPPINLKQ